jgi:deoxyribonuclease-2
LERILHTLIMMKAVLLLAFLASVTAMRCIGDTGSTRDFWVIMKEPNSAVYGYYDTYSRGNMKVSSNTLDTGNGALGNTLKQIYSEVESGNGTDFGYVFYNDEFPEGKKHGSPWAHAKGVLGFDDNGAFWLVHSVPRFPTYTKDGYDGCCYSDTYGQSYLCMEFDSLSEINTIGQQMQIRRPAVYDYKLPVGFADKMPDLANWLKGSYDHNPDTSSVELRTAGGRTFRDHAKTHYWGKDLYEDLVAPAEEEDLLACTWQNGAGGVLPTFCKPDYAWDVYNIEGIGLSDGSSWLTTQDHSKWAVSRGGNVACIGDINRVASQESRGGGTVCHTDSDLWSAMNATVKATQPCS